MHEYRKQFIEEMIMTTRGSGVSGAVRRLINKVGAWSEALSYSGFDYTLDRIAVVERELAEIKDRMRRFEASGTKAQEMPPTGSHAD